jgi:hypothetical protein
LWWGEKQQGAVAMNLFCSLSRAARIMIWVAILSALLGLFLGYQAGSSAANPAGTARPAATAPPDARN